MTSGKYFCIVLVHVILASTSKVCPFAPKQKYKFQKQHHVRDKIPIPCNSLTAIGGQQGPSLTNLILDPVVVNAIEEEDGELSYYYRGLTNVSNGVRTWRAALPKGRLPGPSEFPNGLLWPDEPLFTKVVNVMVLLQFPRFTQRHPEAISSVLLSIVRLSVQFLAALDEVERTKDRGDQKVCGIDGDEDDTAAVRCIEMVSDLNARAIADEYGNIFAEQWGPVVGGVGILNQLFGFGHGLLCAENESSKETVRSGFGLKDGVWKHNGWKLIPEYYRQLSLMPELRKLVRELGQRPTVENRDHTEKFKARKRDTKGGMGAKVDPQSRDSVSGITFSSNFADMLPSEAVLLRSSVPALRRLFLQKKVESKLLSYDHSGWIDVPSVPYISPLRMERMPCAPGGPIIVCLDTSWSMSSRRENLSKAAVLACVCAAHSQGRDCQVIAFSTERNVIEAISLAANTKGIQSLLSFLANSFGGGTDVTGALKFAMEALDSEMMSGADILLVTDGEIPDPPVSPSMMEALDHLKLRNGVEMHGLLVGKNESKPLSKLCTRVHNFLNAHENAFLARGRSLSRLNCFSSEIPTSRHKGSSLYRRQTGGLGERRSSFLRAKREGNTEDEWDRKNRKIRRNKTRNEGDKEYDDENGDFDMNEEESTRSTFFDSVDDALEQLTVSVQETLLRVDWSPDVLEEERQAIGSCWQYRDVLLSAINGVGEGLVERSEEARLVVLACLATEHILLLGVPGTGKSVLGRRLSVLCNGRFFQRLLTRFTTPEELFGPLSLRSLEKDEYRRVTAGYLPTASVAFLDEIFKSNSSILNTLLTILNERKFDNAGGQENCPIRCVVGASNELPDSEELIALYDRFLLRKEVKPVSDEGLVKLLSMSNPGGSACDNNGNDECGILFTKGLDDVVAALASAADSVSMGLDACELVRDLRTFLREKLNVEISDRRFVKASRLLKISAACHGRTRVDPIDCMLLQHCVWKIPEERVAIKEWLWDNITPSSRGDSAGSVAQLKFLVDGLRQEILALVRRTSGDVTGSSGAKDSDVAALKALATETSQLVNILQGKKADLDRHAELLHQSNEFLWLDPDEAEAMKQLLLPRVSAIAADIGETLSNAMKLQLSIERPDIISNDHRLSVVENLFQEGQELLVTCLLPPVFVT